MINSITLLGSSSGRNAGDAALISGIMDSIDSATGKRVLYEIPTIKPQFITKNYENRVLPVSMLPWHGSLKMLGLPTYRSLMRSDLMLVFDAILFDRDLYNPLFNFLSTLYLLLPLAKKRGKMLGCFNVGAGPVNTKTGQRMLKDICNIMDFITVRDEDSLKILRDIGVSNPRVLVTADAALNVKASSPEKVRLLIQEAGLDPDKEILAINISKYLDSWVSPEHKPMGKSSFLPVFVEAIESVARELDVQLLFVCTQHHDVPLTKEVMQAVSFGSKGLIANTHCSHYDIKGVLGKVSLLFGMRLHATILATAGLTPTVALPHQPKVNHYFRTLGLERYVMDFNNFSVEAIKEAIITGWKERTEIRNRLEERIPEQQRKARIAADLVAALDRGGNIDQVCDWQKP